MSIDMDIVDKKENSLFSRVEVSGVVSFEGATPSRQELAKALSDKLKVPSDRVVIRKIGTAFGSKKASFNANVYKDAAGMAIEQKHLVMRGKPKKSGEASEAKEEAPAETVSKAKEPEVKEAAAEKKPAAKEMEKKHVKEAEA